MRWKIGDPTVGDWLFGAADDAEDIFGYENLNLVQVFCSNGGDEVVMREWRRGFVGDR